MEHNIVLAPEILGYIGSLPVTNTLLVSWATMLLLIIAALVVRISIKTIPGGFQNFFEVIIDGAYSTVEDLAHAKAKVFFPFLMTFFLFIITANWLGLLPGFATVGFWKAEPLHIEEKTESEAATPASAQPQAKEEIADEHGHEASFLPSTAPAAAPAETGEAAHSEEESATHKVFVPLLRSINSDLNMTLALALISAAVTHFFAIRYLGIFEYLKKWFSLNPIFLFVGLLELVGEFTKIVSLSFRLFGNIFAGEVVLTTVATLAPWTAFFVPLPFYFLEIIVGFVQAAVFMMLTLVFMVLLSEKHEAH
jgi:F-type H+-transporting ATPase subunit a